MPQLYPSIATVRRLARRYDRIPLYRELDLSAVGLLSLLKALQVCDLDRTRNLAITTTGLTETIAFPCNRRLPLFRRQDLDSERLPSTDLTMGRN